MDRYPVCTLQAIVQFLLLQCLEFRLQLVLPDQHVPSKHGDKQEAHLVDHIAHSYWIRDCIRNFICQILLFPNRIHDLIDLLHFPGVLLAIASPKTEHAQAAMDTL